MLRDTVTRIHYQFRRCLKRGIAVFVVCCVVGLIRTPYCKAPNDTWTASTYSQSDNSYYPSNILKEYGYIIARNNIATNKENSDTNTTKDNYFHDIVCSVEIKFSDLIIAFLTYCLVLVSWYQMRISDETAKRTNRAYIVCSGLYGIPRKFPQTPYQIYSPKATNYREPWGMMISNHGNTPGFITRIRWGVLPISKYPNPDEVMPTEIIRNSSKYSVHIETASIKDIIPPTKDKPTRYRYVDPIRKVDEVFFGRIDYKDVFGKRHWSAFALRHREAHTDTIGTAYIRDKDQ